MDEVPRYMAQADIGIYTAISDPHMDVAVPTKVLEYAFMGLPVVAARLRILEEMFVSSSLLFFEPKDVEGFAQKVMELYDCPERRVELVEEMDRTFVNVRQGDQERQAYFRLLDSLVHRGLADA